MSFYRPPQKQPYNWRERQAETARKAAEEEQRKKMEFNDQNFPSLSSKPVNQRDNVPGNRFAKLAEKWAIDAEVDRRMEEYKKNKEIADKHENERIMSHYRQQSRYERYDEDYEEETTTEPQPVTNSVLDDDGLWMEAKRKTRKSKRELTVEELDERARQMDREDLEDDFNGHLFDSNRHDHDRV